MARPVPDLAEACESCRFYRAAKTLPMGMVADVRGKCRRYPQSVDKLPGEWCGEFRRQGEK